MPEINETILHYRILEKLGEGGMGVVYLAEDTKLKRQVAIKFLPHHIAQNSDAHKRFEIEAKAAAALNHSNIATIHAIEETGDELFIVMEYITGKHLKEHINSKPLSIEEAINIATQIAEGLQAAHKKKIVHRDIKSANIMSTEDGQVKIMDFGLAKIAGGVQLTKEHSTLGTAAYMSPEQARGEEVDHRSDIWSFGVVLYEMLTGKLPFKGDYEQAVIYSILNEDPHQITGIPTGVPIEMEKIVTKCLIKLSSDRYQDVDELIVDLRRVKEQSASKTSQTQPETPATKKKSRLFVSSMVVSILVFIAVLYFVFFKTAEDVGSFAERKKLVVLPFKNLGLPEDEYFADGITVEITSRLSEIKQLGIIDRRSADLYKNTRKSNDQIGEELGVDYILEGSVRLEKLPEEEGRIRVIPSLTKISDGTHLWTKRYDAILESVFDLQSDIAEKVAKALDITLLGAEKKSISQKPTDNLEAYDYYLRGKNYHHQRAGGEENHRVAEIMYLNAIELDSNFVLPYIRIAEIDIKYYWSHWDRNKSRLTRAKNFIDKAIAINPDIPEIYGALGQYYYAGFLNYKKALFELENGLKISPDNGEIVRWIGIIKRRQGKFEEAISYLKRSIELNPLSRYNIDISEIYLLLRKYEDAEEYIDIAISSIPEWGYSYYWKAKIYILRNGDVKRAVQILKGGFDVVNQENMYVAFLFIQIKILEGKYEEALKMLSNEPANVFEDDDSFMSKSQIEATIYGLQNSKNLEKIYYDSARDVIESKLTTLPDDARLHSALGIIFAGLGKKNEAIREGIRATELLAITKDAWRGFNRELDLAKIYSMVGEYDLAIDKLEYLLSIPGELSVPYIKLDPVWRPLLEIPRFQKILEENE